MKTALKLLSVTLFGLALQAQAAEVIELNNPDTHTYSNAQVWNVYCEWGGTTCELAGKVIPKKELPKHIPRAEWGYCLGDFCYGGRVGTDDVYDVIGLNPSVH